MNHRVCTLALIKKGRNTEQNLIKIAENIEENYNIKPNEICNMISEIFDGVIDSSTIRKYLPEKYKQYQRKLNVCDICGKTKIKSLSRHMKNSHGKIIV